MGENFDIKQVEAVNGGTLIQVDFRGETSGGRMFIPTHQVLMALNNALHAEWERVEIEDFGGEKIDPNSPAYGLLTPLTNPTPPTEEKEG